MPRYTEKLKRLNIWMQMLVIAVLNIACSRTEDAGRQKGEAKMMVRIAELEIHPAYLDEYTAVLKEEARASLREEPGVLCIYPMFLKSSPNQIRLLEIYADSQAYESHLRSKHFVKYKTTTLKMVKSLRLVEMAALDPEVMSEVFRKLEDSAF